MRAVVLVLLVACGRVGFDPRGADGGLGGDGSVEPPSSGTRLKVKWVELDGVRLPGGIYDSELGKDCTPLPTLEGFRCIPLLSLAIVGYTDAACTQPIGISFDRDCPTLSADYFLEIAPAGSCDIEIGGVYERAGSLGPGNVYVSFDGQSCMGPVEFPERIALGDVVPLADLAPIDLGTPTGGDRLRVRYFDSPDGFHLPANVHDSSLGADCFPQTVGSREVCAPQPMSSVYTDAACTMPIGIDDAGCPPSGYIEVRENHCFEGERRYFERGAMMAVPAQKYNLAGGSCQPAGNVGIDAFALGPEVSVAEITRTVGTSGGRIVPITGPGALGIYDGWYDTILGAECYPQETPTGFSCVPSNTATNIYYTNASCTNRVDVIETDASCGVPRFATVRDGCGVMLSVHEVGAMVTGNLYEDLGAGCMLASFTGEAFFAGPQVSLSSGTVSIDP